MTQEAPKTPLKSPLAADLVKVLRATAKSNLSTLSNITQIAGESAREALETLQQQGYVMEHTILKRDGVASTLYSLAIKGEGALRAIEEALSYAAVAAPRSSRLCTSVYQGPELRPYVGRAGSMDAFRHPSRVGNSLRHPDGSVTPLKLGAP